jgi:D-beta-D-heptose 7-phosphate kinase/D-beta-D-heptose 1-phosphate adenosyltransferase
MKTIWTNGCFDILHRGHIELFKYAKSLGGRLIVGIDSDEKVKEDKGANRPFNNVEDRKYLLGAICYIDEIYDFNSAEALESLIKKIKPDIIVIGSDWEGKEVVGSQYVKEIKYFKRIENYSTTRILENQGKQKGEIK